MVIDTGIGVSPYTLPTWGLVRNQVCPDVVLLSHSEESEHFPLDSGMLTTIRMEVRLRKWSLRFCQRYEWPPCHRVKQQELVSCHVQDTGR